MASQAIRNRKAITSIKKNNGDITTDPVKINEEFREFYKKNFITQKQK